MMNDELKKRTWAVLPLIAEYMRAFGYRDVGVALVKAELELPASERSIIGKSAARMLRDREIWDSTDEVLPK